MDISDYRKCLETKAGLAGMKVIYGMTGVSTLEAVRLSMSLCSALRCGRVSDIPSMSRSYMYRIVDEALEYRTPKVIPKTGPSRLREGKFKASLVYHEQIFEVLCEGSRVSLLLLFAYERHTGLLFAKVSAKPTYEYRKTFILTVIDAMQSRAITRLQEAVKIQELAYTTLDSDIWEKDFENGLTADLLSEEKKIQLMSDVRATISWKQLAPVKGVQTGPWNAPIMQGAIYLRMEESLFTRWLPVWIEKVNTDALDRLGGVFKKDVRYQVEMTGLFPDFKIKNAVSKEPEKTGLAQLADLESIRGIPVKRKKRKEEESESVSD